ncbi:MAG: serine--tRNA ligase, partial [Clostridiales bacterium]|nr:serine--tRNA ligase [Clostridiales bacterium]
MLDLKFIRANPEKVKEGLAKRGEDIDIDRLLELDGKRRDLLSEAEQLKSRQNAVSKEVPKLKKEGKDVAPILEEMKQLSEKVKQMEGELRELDQQIQDIMYSIPNIPHPSVPVGDSEDDNVPVRYWGEPRKFDFEAKAHWDIGTE